VAGILYDRGLETFPGAVDAEYATQKSLASPVEMLPSFS